MRTPPSDLATAWRQGYQAGMDEIAFNTIQRNPYEDPNSTGIAVGDIMLYVGDRPVLDNKRVRILSLIPGSGEGPQVVVKVLYSPGIKPDSTTYSVPLKHLAKLPAKAPEPEPKVDPPEPTWYRGDRVRYLGPNRELYGLTGYVTETKYGSLGAVAALSFEVTPADKPTWALAVNLQPADSEDLKAEAEPEPEPLRYEEVNDYYPTYACPRCGALVQSPTDHDRWHAEQEAVLATLPRERDLAALRSRIDTMRKGTR